MTQDEIIRMAREAGAYKNCDVWQMNAELFERFAALVRADLMKQVMSACEAEYKKYDQLVVEEDTGHEEATAMIHLMRKLEKLK